MSAEEIAAKHSQRIRAEALERRDLIRQHWPEMAAEIEDLAKIFTGAHLGAISAPWLTWKREGIWEGADAYSGADMRRDRGIYVESKK